MYDQQKKEYLMHMAKEIRYKTVHVSFLSMRDVEILTRIGIPDSFSPYIDIIPGEKYGGYSLYDRINKYENYPLDNEEFKDMCLIGQSGDGYLVITKDGSVHNYDTDSMKLYFVNTSLDAFLDFAYEYSRFVDSVIEKNGEDAYLDGNYSEEDVASLTEALTLIDKAAVEEGFWVEELADLIDNIES